MKKTKLTNVLNNSTSEATLGILNSVPDIKIVCKLDEALRKRGLTQAKLAVLTGLRPSAISDVVNNTRFAITKSHIISIMIALRITDIREIIDIEFAPETVEQFNKESTEWVEEGTFPQEIVQIYSKNAKNAFSLDITE